MSKHALFVCAALLTGILAGFAGRFLLKVLAVFSLVAGPGLYEPLIAYAERPETFWTVAASVAAGTAALIYVVCGIIWLVRAKDSAR